MLTTTIQDDTAMHKLEGSCTIFEVAELKKALLGAIHPDKTNRLDLSACAEVDSAGIQLLGSFRLYCKNENVACEIKGLSEEGKRLRALLGLETVMECA